MLGNSFFKNLTEERRLFTYNRNQLITNRKQGSKKVMILSFSTLDKIYPDYLKHCKWKLWRRFSNISFLCVILLSSHQNNEHAGAGLISVFYSGWLVELLTIFALSSLTSMSWLCGHAAFVVKLWAVKNFRVNVTELSDMPKWWVRLLNSRLIAY